MDAPIYATIPESERMAAYLAYLNRKRPQSKAKYRTPEVEVIDQYHPLYRRPMVSLPMEGPFCCERCGAVNGCDCPVSAPPACGDDDLRFTMARP